jgi:hypothetical protein
MEKKHFQLEAKENSKVTMIFQVIFGIFCIVIGLYWAIFHFSSLNEDPTLWITIAFLAGFGTYQIAAGLGKIKKYITFEEDRIILKKSSFLPKAEMKSTDIEKIDIFPLSICFLTKNKRKKILRFGMSFTDIINPVKDAAADFANLNNIAIEEKKEEI